MESSVRNRLRLLLVLSLLLIVLNVAATLSGFYQPLQAGCDCSRLQTLWLHLQRH